MKLFECQACGQTLFFENTRCEACGRRLGYAPGPAEILALDPAPGDDARWTAHGDPDGPAYRFCANERYAACNWLLLDADARSFCASCRHNLVVPDLARADHARAWRKVQVAKHRLTYTLQRLNLPLVTRGDDPAEGLGFEVKADPDDPAQPRVMTGHEAGVVTLNLAEADDVERERRRALFGEPYRTLLGHFRHEVAHWYWDRLVRDRPANLERLRASFGDERADYGAALRRHYKHGPPVDWKDSFVSSYATAHPWEDWAETFAHYLHIVDTLETGVAYGLRVRPRTSRGAELSADLAFDPYRVPGVEQLVDAWVPLTFALNSLNRSMGQADLYPFVLTRATVAKLGVVHAVVHG